MDGECEAEVVSERCQSASVHVFPTLLGLAVDRCGPGRRWTLDNERKKYRQTRKEKFSLKAIVKASG